MIILLMLILKREKENQIEDSFNGWKGYALHSNSHKIISALEKSVLGL